MQTPLLRALLALLAVSRAAGSRETLRAHADADPTNDEVVAPPAPIPDCETRLRAAGVTFKSASLPVRTQRGGFECGAPQVVTYVRGPEHIHYNAPPLLSCNMALALADFERTTEEEAAREFGKRVVRIEQGGTYSCRKMARFSLVSEHSYANAIDVKAMVLDDGRRIEVGRHFGPLDGEPRAPEGRFLRALSRRLYDEGVFSVVLTRYFDELHRDHFHLDLARYRVDGTRASGMDPPGK